MVMEKIQEAEDFVEALYAFVASELRRVSDVTYSREGVKITDARNHLFCPVENAVTDEASDVYLLVDLCHTDEDMQTVPDKMRMWRVARNYWTI